MSPKEVYGEFPRTTALGGSGFVGGSFLKFTTETVSSPTSSEVDISDLDSVRQHLVEHQIEVVINFAAFSDVKDAQRQNGDKEGLAWTTNVEGAKKVAEACAREGILLVHISTDNVFLETNGPASEGNKPKNSGEVDWYGHTKKVGEEKVLESGVKCAIVRIAYPFGDKNSKKDFVNKLLSSIQAGYPIFVDQHFTPTYLPTLSQALTIIVAERKTGHFHVVCPDITTPYEVGQYLAELLKLGYVVSKGSLEEYEKTYGKSPYKKSGGLLAYETQKEIGIVFPSWKDALKEFIDTQFLESGSRL